LDINIFNKAIIRKPTMEIKPSEYKITRTYTIEPKLYEQVKQCADKKGRIISSIINQSLQKFVDASL